VWDSVYDSVGHSVGHSAYDSVRAYVGSLFYIWEGEYPYQPAVDLWRQGLVASYDGETWRLHGHTDARVLWEGSREELGKAV